MATNCYGARRLSDLLQEQQEEPQRFLPLLLRDDEPPRRSPVEACGRRLRDLCAVRTKRPTTTVSGGSLLHCCGAATRALLRRRRDDLAACFGFGFSFGFGCGARRQRQRFRFRRLVPRGGGGGAGDRCGGDAPPEDCGRQLSPVSVLDLLRSDDDDGDDEEESAVRSTSGSSRWDDDGDDDSELRPSTPASSPPSDHDHNLPAAAAPPCSTFFVASNGKILRALLQPEFEGGKGWLQRKRAPPSSEEMGQATASGWETTAADISRVPTLVATDLSASAREWKADEEARRRVGQSIEAMIFEEVRREAVRDMISSPRVRQTLS